MRLKATVEIRRFLAEFHLQHTSPRHYFTSAEKKRWRNKGASAFPYMRSEFLSSHYNSTCALSVNQNAARHEIPPVRRDGHRPLCAFLRGISKRVCAKRVAFNPPLCAETVINRGARF